MTRPFLEIAVDNVTDACAAARHGADRLELAFDLNCHGFTAPPDLVRAVVASVTVPVMAMVRPGTDDTGVDNLAFADMLKSADAAVLAGAKGLVFGLLTPTGHIDRVRTRELIEVAGGLEVVFHRAFDFASDPCDALEDLVSLGVTRVLTAGIGSWSVGAPHRLETRMDRVRSLTRQAGGRIQILPAGGIRAENAAAWMSHTGCRQLHSACRRQNALPCAQSPTLDSEMLERLRSAMDQAHRTDLSPPPCHDSPSDVS